MNKMVEENRRFNIQRTNSLIDLKARMNEIRKSKNEVVSSDMDKLQENLSTLARTSQEILKEQNVLRSLRFEEIQVRFEQIPKNYAKTLHWVVEPSGPENKIKFIKWLEDSTPHRRLYWVSGKAGSGKSTLMKFISDHPKTVTALQNWAGSDTLVTASFFFWFYGTAMQKSQEGLLQTLLHEILRKCPNLIQMYLPHRWSGETQGPWTRDELLEALKALGQGLTTSTKFCFFIDGLDEYYGEPRDLLPVIKNLSDSPNIKICVSSRPWQIFKDEFDRNPDQVLYLHELTYRDIQVYVHEAFENDTNFQQAKEENAGYEEIVNEIVERAQGVWVWVALVTKSLLNGFTYGDSLKTLRRRLHSLPVDLEGFFQHMLDSVEQVYLSQTAETFLIALAAREELPLLIYSFLDDIREDPSFALSKSVPTSSKQIKKSKFSGALDRLSKREIQMQKRLDARTKGLLEVSERGLGPIWYNNRVVFLHRTVGEFLNRKDVKAKFVESAGANFDPMTSLCHGLLAVVKIIPTFPDKRNFIHELLDYARLSELESAVTQTEVIDELERSLCLTHSRTCGFKLGQKRRSLKLNRELMRYSDSCSILELCVQHGLSIYVKHRLELDASLVSSQEWHQHLLSHALLPTNPAIRYHRSNPTTMTRLLLEHGADPNARDSGSTIWCRFVRDMIKSPSKSKLEVMYLLLSKGADPSEGNVLFETLTISPKSSAKSYQVHMLDKLLECGANPNAKFDKSTVWKRYLKYLLHSKSNVEKTNSLQTGFEQVKKLLLSGADPNTTSCDKTVDQIIEATFGTTHATELLDTVRQMRLRAEGGIFSRVWKTWGRSMQLTHWGPTSTSIDTDLSYTRNRSSDI